MHPDVVELRNFYAQPLGGMVRRLLGHRIRARWRRVSGMTLMGLGFATPYLGSFRGEATCLGALMPASQGALLWPSSGPVHTVLVEEESLPLPDSTVDNLLAVHCLEASEHVRELLREIWRVLKPEGRLLIVVPNRRGVWARLDTTPFGHGRPYSRAQLERLLSDSLFSPVDWGAALYLPPVDRPLVLRSAMAMERLGARAWPAFAGVIMVEAKKVLMAPIAKSSRTRVLKELIPARGGTARSQWTPHWNRRRVLANYVCQDERPAPRAVSEPGSERRAACHQEYCLFADEVVHG
jgi:SAM-dependent methyltransferase